MSEKKAKEHERRVISTREEMRRAAIDIARTANRSLAIFTHDLEPGIYDDMDFLEVIKRLILSRAYARVRVLIADPSRAIKNGNRFVALGRRLNSFIEFRHVREDYRNHREAYCIADGGGIVYRLDATRWEGIVDRNVPAVTDMYLTTFDEIWHASEVEHEFRRLNI